MPEPFAVRESVQKARRGDIALQRALANMYADGWAAIAAEQQAFARYVEQQIAKGAPVSPSWANRDARYIQLQSRIYQTLRDFGNGATTLLSSRTPGLVADVLARTAGEAASWLPREPGITVPGFGNEAWSLINKEAMLAANAIVSDLDSPLRQLLSRDLPESAVAAFKQEWSKGLLTGKNPLRIASQVSKRISQLSLARAQLIARTEFHRAYREGKQEQFQRSDVIDGWIWRAACDRRTCAVCWGMHGTVHPTTETLAGHPACRCVMVPKTRDWEDLGFSGIKDTRPQIEPGEARFSRLPPDMQQKILGPGRFKMYNEGRSLQSMIGQRHSPLWGPMKTLEPIRFGSKPTMPQTPPSNTIRDSSNSIRAGAVETGILVGPSGQVLLNKSEGSVDSVNFNPIELAMFKGNTLIHNHPSNNSFSPDDAALMVYSQLKSIMAVGTKYDHVMTPRYPIWTEDGHKVTETHMRTLSAEVNKEVRAEFTTKIGRGEMTIAEAEANHWHEVWTRLDARLDGALGYRRVPPGEG